MQQKKNFIFINDPFTCSNCGHENPPLPRGCRNHCRKCLYSLHVDDEVPGDRASECHGLMKPIGPEYSGKKGQMILHKCQKCGKEIRNMLAEDDNLESFLDLQK